MIDIKKMIGEPSLISKEEIISKRVTETQVGCLIFSMATDNPKSGSRNPYESIKPLIEQLEFDLQGQGFNLNRFAKRTIERNIQDAVNYVLTEEPEKGKGLCIMGSIEKWIGLVYSDKENPVTHVITLNLCEVFDVIDGAFESDKANTISVFTVPLNKHGIIDIVGANISVMDIAQSVNNNLGI